MRRGPRACVRALVLAALASLAGCAPRPPLAPVEDAQRLAYASARDHRAALLRALDAEAVVRVDGRATGRLPAVSATLRVAAPDRVRLLATALPGMSLDLLLDRDSVWAWVPSQRLAVAAAQESLGIGAPAELMGRVLGATWDPPMAAWGSATRDSAGACLRWRDGGDSLALWVDPAGRPLAAWLGRGGRGVHVGYESWTHVGGEPFPERSELVDDTGWARVRIRLDSARSLAHAGHDWFEPRRGEARTMGWDQVRELLGRLGTP